MPSKPRAEISNPEIEGILGSFGISLVADQVDEIREYTSLLLKWSRSVSLTAITDPAQIVTRHFGESIFVAKLLPVENCRLADVGTGAGFPGLAIKIAFPTVRVVLIESNKKKCAFLHEVIRSLELTDVQVVSERFEEIRPETVQTDLITARAIGEFKPLLRWSAQALATWGHILLWVGSEDSTRISQMPGWTWQPAVHIPESQRRFLLLGRPSNNDEP